MEVAILRGVWKCSRKHYLDRSKELVIYDLNEVGGDMCIILSYDTDNVVPIKLRRKIKVEKFS